MVYEKLSISYGDWYLLILNKPNLNVILIVVNRMVYYLMHCSVIKNKLIYWVLLENIYHQLMTLIDYASNVKK